MKSLYFPTLLHLYLSWAWNFPLGPPFSRLNWKQVMNWTQSIDIYTKDKKKKEEEEVCERKIMEKLLSSGVRHLFVTVFLSTVAAVMVLPAITDVTMAALCPGRDECSLAIYLSGFQQAVKQQTTLPFFIFYFLLFFFFLLQLFLFLIFFSKILQR